MRSTRQGNCQPHRHQAWHNLQPHPLPRDGYLAGFLAADTGHYKPDTELVAELVRRVVEINESVSILMREHKAIEFEHALGLTFHDDRFYRKFNLLMRYQALLNHSRREIVRLADLCNLNKPMPAGGQIVNLCVPGVPK